MVKNKKSSYQSNQPMLLGTEQAPLKDLVSVALEKDQGSNSLNHLILKIKSSYQSKLPMLPGIERAQLADLVSIALEKDQRSNSLNRLTLKIKKHIQLISNN